MSSNVSSANHGLSFDKIDIDDFIRESKRIGVSAAQTRKQRSRRKNIKRNVSKASLIAPLLAAEGCLTIGKEDIALTPPKGSNKPPAEETSTGGGGGTTPAGTPPPAFSATNDSLTATANEQITVSAAELLANDIHGNSDTLELVRVFNAVNGTVFLDGGIVTFQPDEGFQGVAQYNYLVRDESGQTRIGKVFVDVEQGVVTVDEDDPDFPIDDDEGGGSGDGGPHQGPGDGPKDDPDHGGDSGTGEDGGDTDTGDGDGDHGDHDGDTGSGGDGGDSGSGDHGDHDGDTGSGGDTGTGDGGGDHGDHDGDTGDDGGDSGSGDHGDHDGDSGDGEDGGDSGSGDSGGDHGDHGGAPSDDGGHVHPDDPSKAGEHTALLSLVPVAEATHVAISGGSWFDPATWASGEVPGEGAKVHIPHGVTVDYDGESASSLFTVRVDGMLHFATDKDTFMEVDTLIVAPSGHMTIGTQSDPVAAGVNAVIQIADNGPIDVGWDPMLLSRGVISHGSIDVHGAEKDSFLKLATDAMAGDTSITLEEAPEGWNVGDRLVLTGTHFTEPPSGPLGEPTNLSTEDEELIITSINGKVVHFASALEYDHDTPRPDLKAYVANYSRNVEVRTENADDVPVHQRGHVMLMHSDDIDVRYAEFNELGRTDKSERAFDADALGSVESDSNVKGRYSLHIHRAGVSDVDDPAMLVGNAVWGSPGWGFVHHDSNAVLADNAAYDVSGAAFVAETGNEIGRWSHNISIKTLGVKGVGDPHNTPKITDDVLAFDLGRTGAGFWFQGRLVDAVDNVAAGAPGGQGFVYFHRGSSGQIDVTPDTLPHPEVLRYDEAAHVQIPSISMFHNNETIASGGGFMVIKSGPQQTHDMRSVISDFTAWEVVYGVHLEYTAHYTFKNIDLVGAENTTLAGFNLGTNVIDLVVNDADISGFDKGVLADRFQTFPAAHDYVFIDTNIEGAATDFDNAGAAFGDLVLSGDDLVEGRLSFQSDYSDIPTLHVEVGSDFIELSGTKTDSIGDIQISPDWDAHTYNWFAAKRAAEEEGFWTLPDGRTVVAFEQYVADRATGALDKISTFVHIDNIFHDDLSAWFDQQGYPNNGVLDLTNEAPNPTTDFATVSENGSVVVDVLANDTDPDGDDLTIDGFIFPKHGDVNVNENGTVTYTPDPNFVGTDHLCYWVDDGQGNLTMGELFVTVEI